MSKLFEQLLEKRGFGGDFLCPKYEDLKDPFLLPDLEKAVSRIKRAAEQGEKVMIFGDYDADGVTASTVMLEGLKLAGVKEIVVRLPNRFTEGYGVSKKIVQEAKEQGVGLVITVDCGSNNKEILEELGEEGIEVVVTDHHEILGELPEVVAVVNPKREDGQGYEELRGLAGVGVAFKVVQGMVKMGLIREGQEKWLLDLVY